MQAPPCWHSESSRGCVGASGIWQMQTDYHVLPVLGRTTAYSILWFPHKLYDVACLTVKISALNGDTPI